MWAIRVAVQPMTQFIFNTSTINFTYQIIGWLLMVVPGIIRDIRAALLSCCFLALLGVLSVGSAFRCAAEDLNGVLHTALNVNL